MSGEDLLETLLESFRANYDVERNCDINGDIYDAYAGFKAASAKYVLVKSAELWRAECFEHVFFCIEKNEMTEGTAKRFRRHILSYIEPELVRHGEKYPPRDHMYTYMTLICICENGLSEEAAKRIRSFRYVKNYKLTIRGYAEARILVFDLKNGRLLGNRAAGELVKGYKKSGII